MKLSCVFTDHMVLQRRKEIRIFGTSSSQVTVIFNGEKHVATPVKDRWCVTYSPMEAGGPYEIQINGDGKKTVLHDVMVGDVFLAAGQSNMTHPTFGTIGGFEKASNYYNNNIRLFTVPHKVDYDEHKYEWQFERVSTKDSLWKICDEESAIHFSAIGFYFADYLQDKLDIPVGIISCNWGGTRIETWIDAELLRDKSDFAYLFEAEKSVPDNYEQQYAQYRKALDKAALNANAIENARKNGAVAFIGNEGIIWPESIEYGPHDPNWPSMLFNTMLSRIAGYPIKSVLWYQGESNTGNFENYYELFNILMMNWIDAWKDEFSFYTVQIAPFKRDNFENWVGLMNEQRKIAQASNRVHLITTTDIGDEELIHPPRKEVVAYKLFCAVMTHEYGEKCEYCGPVFEEFSVQGNKIILKFSHAIGGLVCDGQINQLEIAGAGEIFKATYGCIDGDFLIVDNSNNDIVYVRLGYAPYTAINLFNKEGYPASPFIVKIK